MRRQLGIGNFEPMKPYFLDIYSASQASLPTLPGMVSLSVALDRGWNSSEDRKQPTSPALVPCPPMLAFVYTVFPCCPRWSGYTGVRDFQGSLHAYHREGMKMS